MINELFERELRNTFLNDVSLAEYVNENYLPISVLNNISAEIADIYCGQYCENPLTSDEVREMALEIIDKYKADIEPQERSE